MYQHILQTVASGTEGLEYITDTFSGSVDATKQITVTKKPSYILVYNTSGSTIAGCLWNSKCNSGKCISIYTSGCAWVNLGTQATFSPIVTSITTSKVTIKCGSNASFNAQNFTYLIIY